MTKNTYKVGDTVTFKGYSDDVPEDEQQLVAGDKYTVAEVNEDEEMVAFEIPNPDFNKKKKVSEDNPETLIIEVFLDEVEPSHDEDEEDEDEPAPVKKAVTKKAPAKGKKAAAEEEHEPEDEPVPAKKPAAKSKKKVAEVTTKGKKGQTAEKTVGKVKKEPAPKDQAEEEFAALENEDEDIVALIEGTENILELASELVEEGAELDYRLGGVLFHVRQSKEYQSLDVRYKENGGFGLYVKEKLNIEYRKAMYLIDIYYKFNLYGIDADKVREIGWTKASKIAAVMTEDNAEDLVELAETSTVADLSDSIKEQYVAEKEGSAGEKKKRVTFKFRLFEDAATGVTEILEQTAETLGTKDLASAFEHIVIEWAAEHLDVKPKAKAKSVGSAGKKQRKQVEEVEE